LAQGLEARRADGTVFECGQHLGDAEWFVVAHAFRQGARTPRLYGALDEVADHAGQAELHAVMRVIDALDAVGMQGGDFLRRDGAATTAEYTDVTGSGLAQHIDHVAEILVVPTLVGADGDTIGVLLNGGADDVGDRAIVPE